MNLLISDYTCKVSLFVDNLENPKLKSKITSNYNRSTQKESLHVWVCVLHRHESIYDGYFTEYHINMLFRVLDSAT